MSRNLVERLRQSQKFLCFAFKGNNGNCKHHINGLVRMKFLAFSNDGPGHTLFYGASMGVYD